MRGPQRRVGIVAALIAAGAAIAALMLMRGADPPIVAQPVEPAATDAADEPAAAVASDASSAGDSSAPPAAESDEVRDYATYKAFESRLQAFLANAATLPLEARLAEAAALTTALAAEEAAGRVRPVEAMMLRLALTRQTTQNPGALREQAQSLVRELDAQSAARTPPAPDPRFTAYKAREAEIVAEVLALPAGPERDALLKQRLDAARAEAYRP